MIVDLGSPSFSTGTTFNYHASPELNHDAFSGFIPEGYFTAYESLERRIPISQWYAPSPQLYPCRQSHPSQGGSTVGRPSCLLALSEVPRV